MATNNVKHGHRSLADEAKTRAQKQNPAPPLHTSKKDKTYTKRELEETTPFADCDTTTF